MLQQSASRRQQSARAPGTFKNHHSSVRVYLAFCQRMHLAPYQVTYQDVCVFIEYLVKFISAPSTIKNKISHVRTHFALMEEPLNVFNHPRVARAIDALERDKTHVSRAKRPLAPHILSQILYALSFDPLSNILRSVFLCICYGAMRQSELLPCSVNKWSAENQPTRSDVTLAQHQCIIFVKKAKNMQKAGQSRNIILASVQDRALCPVSAFERVFLDTPTRRPNDPLYMFPDKRTPIPVSYVKNQLERLLVHTGNGDSIPYISLHSLRKATATNAYNQGCDELSIKRYGAWSSDAYATYITTSNANVNQRLINSLHQ